MSGYIGNIPVPQATQTRDTFTATASQTTFATSGYTPSFLDVFLNGVHLVNGTDYTASNGSDVVLTSGAAAGDTLEVVAYSTYQVNSQNYTGGLTVDNDGATVLTVDRATSDGTIIDLQRNGTTVGSIGSVSGGADLMIGTDTTGLRFYDGSNADGGVGIIVPWNVTSNAARDAQMNLGSSTERYRNLYLSGGVYLGGTGAANYLDDYEEGTWTPTDGSGAGLTFTVNFAKYTKIGNVCHLQTYLVYPSTADTNFTQINGLPFATASQGFAAFYVNSNTEVMAQIEQGVSYLRLKNLSNATYTNSQLDGRFIIFSGTYITA